MAPGVKITEGLERYGQLLGSPVLVDLRLEIFGSFFATAHIKRIPGNQTMIIPNMRSLSSATFDSGPNANKNLRRLRVCFAETSNVNMISKSDCSIIVQFTQESLNIYVRLWD